MTKTCEECSSEFETTDRRKRFCNRSCSAKFNNKGVTRHGVPSSSCLRCGVKTVPYRNKSGYCSTSCRQEHEIEQWLAGNLSGCWKYSYAAYVRRWLERKTNTSCEACGFNTLRTDGTNILQVDHIDGNWENNRPENVRLLCPNCHAMTDNWGAKNMGNGRKWKSQYKQF